MNWTYSIKNKIAASGVLFFLCLLVLLSNYIDRNHTDDVKNAIMSVIHNQFPKKNHLMQISEFEENSFIRPDNPFLNDNFD